MPAVRRSIACVLVGALLLAAGCGDDGADGPPPTAEVVDCGLTNPQRGEAQAFAQVRVTNAGGDAGRVRVVVRFLAGGAEIGRGEASSEELDGGHAMVVNAVGADGATAVDACEVAEVERL